MLKKPPTIKELKLTTSLTEILRGFKLEKFRIFLEKFRNRKACDEFFPLIPFGEAIYLDNI